MPYRDALLFLLPKKGGKLKIPLYSHIQAGDAVPDHVIYQKGKIDLNELLIAGQKAFLALVQAATFQDFGFVEGDILVVHYHSPPKKHDIVLVKEPKAIPSFQFYSRRTPSNFVVGVVTAIIKFYKKLIGQAETKQIQSAPVFGRKQKAQFYHFNLNKAVIKHPSDTFLLEVRGESMKDARIYDRDLLIVDKHLPAGHKDIIAAYLNGGYTLKYWEKDKPRPKLAPANKDFSKIPIPYDEDAKSDGVIVAAIQRLRKNISP